MAAQTIIESEKPWEMRTTLYHSEDASETLPAVRNPFDGTVFDLTGKVLTIYFAPSYDYATAFKVLTSTPASGILIDDAAAGLASIHVPRTDVRDDIPTGRWVNWLNLSWTDGLLGPVTRTWARGPLLVLPARALS